MGTILNTNEHHKLSNLKTPGQKLVLVGGCFDILHASHIEFLKRAKALGDILVVLLESDTKINKLKGNGRPVNSQSDRAVILSNIPHVDLVVMLENPMNDGDYEILVKTIEPDIIAVTAGNKIFDWEREYTKNTGKKIVEVMDRQPEHSTTKIVKSIKL